MSNKRLIDVGITEDPYLSEQCEPDEKLVFYQALIHSGSTGFIPYSLILFSGRAGISIPRLKEIIQKFSDADKLYYCEGWLVIVNHYKYYNLSNSNNAKATLKELQKVPVTILENHPKINQIYNRMTCLCNNSVNPEEQRRSNNKTEINNAVTQEQNRNITPLQQENNAVVEDQNEKETPSRARADNNIQSSYSLLNNNNFNSIPPIPPEGDHGSGRETTLKKLNQPLKGTKRNLLRSPQEGKEGYEELAEGVYMTPDEQRKFKSIYGDELFLEIPDKLSQWAKDKGNQIINGYSMCEIFAKEAIKKAKHG